MSLENWRGCSTPGGVVLDGRFMTLEPLDMRLHAAGLFEALRGDDIWTNLPFEGFSTVDAFQDEFGCAVETRGWIAYAFRRKSDGKLLGTASYMRLREAHGSVEIGCVAFGDELKRTREATEAMYLMARHVFEDCGFRRYEWKCDNENSPSRRAAARLGFTYEGLFRQDMVFKGRNRDTAWFSMLDSEWPDVSAAMLEWMSDENFDLAGRQKIPLSVFRG